MKTLIIIGVILAVLSLYFVVNADKSILVKGGEVWPTGTDIVKFVLNKARNLSSQIKTGNFPGFSNDKIGDASYKVIDKAREFISGSIENKLVETFCPAK